MDTDQYDEYDRRLIPRGRSNISVVPVPASADAVTNNPPPTQTTDTEAPPVGRAGTLVAILVPAIVALLLYRPSLRNGFIWDDPIIIRQQLVAFQNLRDVFLPPGGIPEFGFYYYRPMVFVSYLIDQYFWGHRAFGFHLSVVITHALCTALVAALGLTMARSTNAVMAALVAGLLFATHPIHTESVCWMSGRSDPLTTLFLLGGLLLYLRGRRRLLVTTLAAVCFLLACLSKEPGITFVLLVPAIDLLLRPDRSIAPAETGVRLVASYLPLAIAAGIYVALRHEALSRMGSPSPTMVPLSEIPEHLIGAIGFYVGKLLLPVNLSAFIANVPTDPATLFIGAATLFAGALGFVVMFARGVRVGSFLCLGFFVTLAPSLAIALTHATENPVAERYLYLPSAMFCLLIGLLVARLINAGRPAAPRFAALIVGVGVVWVCGLYGLATYRRNAVWADEFLFWQSAVAQAPNEGLPHQHLGGAYNRRGDKQRAEAEFWAAITASYNNKGRAIAFNNLGLLRLDANDWPKAQEYLQHSIELRPTYPLPYFNLGLLYARRFESVRESDPQEALQLIRNARTQLDKAIDLNPRYVKAWELLMRVAFAANDRPTARRAAQVLLQLDPHGPYIESAQKMLALVGTS